MSKDGLKVSASYFLIHMFVEIVCFDVLYTVFHHQGVVWSIALLFDFFAFVPQGVIGDFYQEHTDIDLGLIGVGLMLVGVISLQWAALIGLILIALGNAFLHEAGAIACTYSSEGKLFPSALFVAGGSFGVVIGQFVKQGTIFRVGCLIAIMVLVITSNPVWKKKQISQPVFDLINQEQSAIFVILVALFVVAARSFIGYCIPISWKKEIWQTFALFFMMGLGKAAGGYLADQYGSRKIAILSTFLSIPFLVAGKDYMLISIVGVFLFSLTMSITFGMFLSVIQNQPGLAFGLTTIGLFVGTLPVFIFGQFSLLVNTIIVIVLSLVSCYGLHLTLK